MSKDAKIKALDFPKKIDELEAITDEIKIENKEIKKIIHEIKKNSITLRWLIGICTLILGSFLTFLIQFNVSQLNTANFNNSELLRKTMSDSNKMLDNRLGRIESHLLKKK